MSITQIVQTQRTPMVVSHRNNPGLPQETIVELTSDGIGVVDYGTDASLEANNDGGATRSFETLIDLSASGGYGVIHTKGFEQVVIGRVPRPAVMFLELEDTDGVNRRFKAFQFDRYAKINLNDFPEVRELLENRSHLSTLNPVRTRSKTASGNPGREAITDAYIRLELEGKLIQPTR